MIAMLMYVALSAIKMRSYLLSGRFWAEEGKFFYSEIIHKPAIDAIFFIFNSHLELVANLIVYTSTFVSLKFAPLVTTYLSLAMQSIPIFIMVRYRESLSLTRGNIILILIIAVGLPQASEVWANSINLYFHFCLLASLMAAIPISDGPPKWVSRLLLVVSGLSGIPANFLVPVFAILAIKTKQSERFVQLAILCATAALQMVLLMSHHFEAGERQYFSTPLTFWLAPVAQSVISPLFGYDVGDQLANILKTSCHLQIGSIIFSLVCSTPLLYFLASACLKKDESTSILIVSAFVLLFMGILTALGDKLALISAAVGGRYFYAPNVLLAIALFASIRKYNVFIAMIVFAVVMSSVINVRHYIGGPRWHSNFEVAGTSNATEYKIWPYGWSMNVLDKPLDKKR